MIPYLPTTKPMKGEEQEALMGILNRTVWNTPSDRLRVANQIIAAGFARTVPQKVSKTQLWSYAIETILLAYCAMVVFETGRMFVFGALCAAAAGSLFTYAGALLINNGIKKGSIK